MATNTANSEYAYNKQYFGVEISDWVTIVHKDLSEASGWNYAPLKPGAFGYDNMAVSVGRVLDYVYRSWSVDDLAGLCERVHAGWAANYRYWRDHEPWKTSPDRYQPPASPLGDKRRNDCAEASYADLPEDEQKKDMIIARSLSKYTADYLESRAQNIKVVNEYRASKAAQEHK